MKRLTVLLVLFCILLSANATFAMSQRGLEETRDRMEQSLSNIPEVSFSDLKDNEKYYKGKVVKFTAVCVGTNDPAAYLQDSDGNRFIVRVVGFYKLKLDTEYTIGAAFQKIVYPEDGDVPAAIFSNEKCHLPFFSEYGL